ncbi:MAG: hypothetical protein Q9208_001850 [Pyrenodesmia sp. 3 TL-2023]
MATTTTTTTTTTAAAAINVDSLFERSLPSRDVPFYEDPNMQAQAYNHHINAYIKLLESRKEYFAAKASQSEEQSQRQHYESLAKHTGTMVLKAYGWEREVRDTGVWLEQLDMLMGWG